MSPYLEHWLTLSNPKEPPLSGKAFLLIVSWAAGEQPVGKNSDDKAHQILVINTDISKYSFQVLHICLFQCAGLVIKEGRLEHQSLNRYFSTLNILSLNSKFLRKLVRKGPLTLH